MEALIVAEEKIQGLSKRSVVRLPNKDLEWVALCLLSEQTTPQDAVNFLKNHQSFSTLINAVYEKAFTLHSHKDPIVTKPLEDFQFFHNKSNATIEAIYSRLSVFWNSDIRPSLPFWVPFCRMVEGSRSFYTDSSGERVVDSMSIFFKDKKLPQPLVRSFLGMVRSEVVNLSLDLPISKDVLKRWSRHSPHLRKTYTELCESVDYSALVKQERMLLAHIFNDCITPDSNKNFPLVLSFCQKKDIDLLLLSRRIFNLGSTEDILSCCEFLACCADRFGPQCLTPSRRLVLYDKHKEKLNKSMSNFSSRPQAIQNLLNYLSVNETHAQIKQALDASNNQEPPRPTPSVRKM